MLYNLRRVWLLLDVCLGDLLFGLLWLWLDLMVFCGLLHYSGVDLYDCLFLLPNGCL